MKNRAGGLLGMRLYPMYPACIPYPYASRVYSDALRDLMGYDRVHNNLQAFFRGQVDRRYATALAAFQLAVASGLL